VPTFSGYWLGQSHAWGKAAQNRKRNRKFSACTLEGMDRNRVFQSLKNARPTRKNT
jgi:hypothetical protein